MRLFTYAPNGIPQQVTDLWSFPWDIARSVYPANGLPADPAVWESLDVSELSLFTVTPTVQQSFDGTKNTIAEASPILINGNWTQTWALTPIPAATIAANQSVALSQAQAIQSNLIQQAYNSAISTPIAYMGTSFPAGAAIQTLITEVLTASGGTLASGFTWYDVNNVAQPITYAQLQGLASEMLNRAQPLFIKQETLLSQIAAATSIAAVQAIVW